MDTAEIEDSEGEDEQDMQQQGVGFIQKFRAIRDEHTSTSSNGVGGGRSYSSPQQTSYTPATDSRFFPKASNSSNSLGGKTDGGIPWLKHEILK